MAVHRVTKRARAQVQLVKQRLVTHGGAVHEMLEMYGLADSASGAPGRP
jgi:hypothetical protein